ncbi:MAG: metallophosphoesterase [Victivallales bacterium]|nr:metallophosphoesterase [Victivallales bacterium]
MKTVTFTAVFLTIALLSISAMDEETSRYYNIAKQFEVTERTTPPKWATRTSPPLFRIAWLTDLHITNTESIKLNHDAFVYVRDVLKPDAVVITGDNIGIQPRTPNGTPVTLQRQRDFQAMLKRALKEIPFWVIPGDNWPQDFDKVFGATHYSFDFGGFHFIFNSVDVTGKNNGCSRFNDSTWKWLRDDLAAHPAQPVVYLQHEPCLPPSFLDANALAELFNQAPQVVLALGGHLHLDLEFKSGHWSQWVGPSIGTQHRPGFKLLAFYPNQILSTGIEWNAETKSFRPVNKFTRVKIPEELRGTLHKPEAGEGAVGYSELPPAPRETDSQLDALESTVMQNVKSFGMRFAVKRFILE